MCWCAIKNLLTHSLPVVHVCVSSRAWRTLQHQSMLCNGKAAGRQNGVSYRTWRVRRVSAAVVLGSLCSPATFTLARRLGGLLLKFVVVVAVIRFLCRCNIDYITILTCNTNAVCTHEYNIRCSTRVWRVMINFIDHQCRGAHEHGQGGTCSPWKCKVFCALAVTVKRSV